MQQPCDLNQAFGADESISWGVDAWEDQVAQSGSRQPFMVQSILNWYKEGQSSQQDAYGCAQPCPRQYKLDNLLPRPRETKSYAGMEEKVPSSESNYFKTQSLISMQQGGTHQINRPLAKQVQRQEFTESCEDYDDDEMDEDEEQCPPEHGVMNYANISGAYGGDYGGDVAGDYGGDYGGDFGGDFSGDFGGEGGDYGDFADDYCNVTPTGFGASGGPNVSDMVGPDSYKTPSPRWHREHLETPASESMPWPIRRRRVMRIPQEYSDPMKQSPGSISIGATKEGPAIRRPRRPDCPELAPVHLSQIQLHDWEIAPKQQTEESDFSVGPQPSSMRSGLLNPPSMGAASISPIYTPCPPGTPKPIPHIPPYKRATSPRKAQAQADPCSPAITSPSRLPPKQAGPSYSPSRLSPTQADPCPPGYSTPSRVSPRRAGPSCPPSRPSPTQADPCPPGYSSPSRVPPKQSQADPCPSGYSSPSRHSPKQADPCPPGYSSPSRPSPKQADLCPAGYSTPPRASPKQAGPGCSPSRISSTQADPCPPGYSSTSRVSPKQADPCPPGYSSPSRVSPEQSQAGPCYSPSRLSPTQADTCPQGYSSPSRVSPKQTDPCPPGYSSPSRVSPKQAGPCPPGYSSPSCVSPTQEGVYSPRVPTPHRMPSSSKGPCPTGISLPQRVQYTDSCPPDVSSSQRVHYSDQYSRVQPTQTISSPSGVSAPPTQPCPCPSGGSPTQAQPSCVPVIQVEPPTMTILDDTGHCEFGPWECNEESIFGPQQTGPSYEHTQGDCIEESTCATQGEFSNMPGSSAQSWPQTPQAFAGAVGPNMSDMLGPNVYSPQRGAPRTEAECPGYPHRVPCDVAQGVASCCREEKGSGLQNLYQQPEPEAEIPASVQECSRAKSCGQVDVDKLDHCRDREIQKMQKQIDRLVKDTYCPGVIQEAVDGSEDFNALAFSLLKINDSHLNYSPKVEPFTLVEAFSRRLNMEREELKARLTDNLTKEQVRNVIKKFFSERHNPSDLNRSLTSHLLAETLVESLNKEEVKKGTFNADVQKGTPEKAPNDTKRVVVYTGTTKPQAPEGGDTKRPSKDSAVTEAPETE